VIDDYGHHPVEIAAVLKAARQFSKGRVIAVHQPHRYTRLHSLFEEFCSCFNEADVVGIADVYAAGEEPIPGASRDDLVSGLIRHGHRHARAVRGEEDLVRLVVEQAGEGTSWCAWAREASRAGRRGCRRGSAPDGRSRRGAREDGGSGGSHGIA
jgi:UDP-N-acetylmuramate--alanine ligase